MTNNLKSDEQTIFKMNKDTLQARVKKLTHIKEWPQLKPAIKWAYEYILDLEAQAAKDSKEITYQVNRAAKAEERVKDLEHQNKHLKLSVHTVDDATIMKMQVLENKVKELEAWIPTTVDFDDQQEKLDKARAKLTTQSSLMEEMAILIKWFTHLLNGVGKNGGEPTDDEFESCNEKAKSILKRYQVWKEKQ